IRAFAKVRASRPARLIILGEGPQEKMLRALAEDLNVSDHIAFPGFVHNPFAYMARAQTFVLSSAWEGFGMVLVEAMACGCPVVSTDCPSGPAEILQGSKYGRLVPVGDHQQLAEAIMATLDAPLPTEVLKARAEVFSDRSAAQLYEQALVG
ncbi:MAG: glycosyltransferase, partial [Planctomycetota bacterium]|nr:glycosyltransferase [Planctomycetota bacterium]